MEIVTYRSNASRSNSERIALSDNLHGRSVIRRVNVKRVEKELEGVIMVSTQIRPTVQVQTPPSPPSVPRYSDAAREGVRKAVLKDVKRERQSRVL